MRRWIVGVMVFALMLGSLTGCAEKPGESTPTTATPAVQTGDNQLDNLMKVAAKHKQMSFDMVATAKEGEEAVNTTGKVYISDKKVRMEMTAMGMEVITIIDASGDSYLYNPATKSAIKMSVPQDADLPNAWVRDDGDTSGMEVIGTETKDGFDCLVVTVTEEGDIAKMWLRKDIGMPVRVEQTTSQGEIVVKYLNYNLGAQPDSLFEVPAGTEVTAIPIMPDVQTID